MMVTMVTFFFLKGRTGKLGTNLFFSVVVVKNKSMLVARLGINHSFPFLELLVRSYVLHVKFGRVEF